MRANEEIKGPSGSSGSYETTNKCNRSNNYTLHIAQYCFVKTMNRKVYVILYQQSLALVLINDHRSCVSRRVTVRLFLPSRPISFKKYVHAQRRWGRSLRRICSLEGIPNSTSSPPSTGVVANDLPATAWPSLFSGLFPGNRAIAMGLIVSDLFPPCHAAHLERWFHRIKASSSLIHIHRHFPFSHPYPCICSYG